MKQPRKLYRTIVADPPWDFHQKGNYGAIKHYSLMSLEQIRNMPVRDIAAPDSTLWLWVTNASLPHGFEVMKAWMFKYKAIFTWAKPRPGLGGHLRNATEHLLLGVRGKVPVKCRNQINWGIFPVQNHSHKPEEIYSIVRRVSQPPYLELFARRHDGNNADFDVWGNEIPSSIILPNFPVPEYSSKVIENTAELQGCQTQEEAERKIWEMEHPDGSRDAADPRELPRLMDFPMAKDSHEKNGREAA